MYPLNVFNLFPPFPSNNKVFVAMDFGKKNEKRWKLVIEPAVRAITTDSTVNGTKLEPYRVDMRKVSDSIITDITYGISKCILFFADVTTVRHCQKKAFRNGNVLYEVGIAHSSRLPEEVILFRSDNDPLLFDLTTIRVNKYDPDKKPEEARNLVKEALICAMKEIDLQRHLSVQRAADALTVDSRKCLQKINVEDRLDIASIIERNNSYRQLIEIGIISASYSNLAPRLLAEDGRVKPEYRFRYPPIGSGRGSEDSSELFFDYEITPFGFAVLDEVMARLN